MDDGRLNVANIQCAHGLDAIGLEDNRVRGFLAASSDGLLFVLDLFLLLLLLQRLLGLLFEPLSVELLLLKFADQAAQEQVFVLFGFFVRGGRVGR